MAEHEVDIWLGGALVARTRTTTRGAKVRLDYTDEVQDRHEPETVLLSCSLPLPGPGAPASTRAFLEGLLPEGEALRAAAAQIRGVRLTLAGVADAPGDVLLLLAEYGRECAGAVTVMPAGTPPETDARHEPLTEEDLAALVRDLPARPLGTDLQRDVRMSLAGAQPKLLLSRVGGRWCEPVGGAPSTHIVKPTTAWPDSARNEALVMDLARVCGLTPVSAWTEVMGSTDVLVVERYDRIVDDERIVRVHQEDMCQAAGIRPGAKYDIGRPRERMARMLRTHADRPGTELRRLFAQVAFRALVGDEDGHGKNHSLLLQEGSVRLSPLYDCLSTLLYPQLSGRLAAPIGDQHTLAKVDRDALLDEARGMGIPAGQAREDLDALVAALRQAVSDAPDALTAGWPSERVLELVLERLRRLERGEPLGAGAGRGARPAAWGVPE